MNHLLSKEKLENVILATVAIIVFSVPLMFSTGVYRIFALPKILLLYTLCALLLLLVTAYLLKYRINGTEKSSPSFSLQSFVLVAYIVMMGLSTVFGVAPISSFWGSFENQMGFLTHICFFICYVGLLIGVRDDQKRLLYVLWSCALSGIVVSVYAVMQFVGRDPFLPPAVYTFPSSSGNIIRICSTLGHSNYLGGFLLFTAPVSMAIGLAYGGRARRISLIAVVLSIIAIIFSGTRGAWLGLVVGGLVFLLLEQRNYLSPWMRKSRPSKLRLGFATVIILGLIVGSIISIPNARTVIVRARSTLTDGITGSGRTLLWKDTLAMIPDFAVVGVGPEGFRRAFLPYKSVELARFSPGANNESPHNSYLDVAVSHGLLGLVFYLALLTSAIGLLYRARLAAPTKTLRVILSGVIASFAGVSLYKFFIHDQIPTGLYYFVFLSIAEASWRITCKEAKNETCKSAGQIGSTRNYISIFRFLRAPALTWALIALSGITVIAAMWYVIEQWKADRSLKQVYEAAIKKQTNPVIMFGNSAARVPDPSRNYLYESARAMIVLIEQLDPKNEVENNLRNQLIDLAETNISRSKPYSLAPDSHDLLLAYMAFLSKDWPGLQRHATEAIQWDPHYANSHWLLAEYHFAKGEKEEARREAKRALEINSYSKEATSVLKRINGQFKAQSLQEMVERAFELIQLKKYEKAKRWISRARILYKDECNECHRMMALVYEAENRPDAAAAEWEVYRRTEAKNRR